MIKLYRIGGREMVARELSPFAKSIIEYQEKII